MAEVAILECGRMSDGLTLVGYAPADSASLNFEGRFYSFDGGLSSSIPPQFVGKHGIYPYDSIKNNPGRLFSEEQDFEQVPKGSAVWAVQIDTRTLETQFGANLRGIKAFVTLKDDSLKFSESYDLSRCSSE